MRGPGILLGDDSRSSRRTMPIHPRADTLGAVNVVESVRARIRAVDPFRADIVLAVLFVIAGVIELSLIDSDGHGRGVTIAAAVVALSSVAFRRRDPLLAAGLFSVPTLIQALLDGFLTTNSTTPFVTVLFLLYSVGRYAPGDWHFPAAIVLLPGVTTFALLYEAGLEFAEIFWAVFLFGLPVLAGRALRSRSLLQAELREKAERAERDRAERARGAVEAERARIASELQALVANGLSAMVVQAETVPRTISTGDIGGASTALAAVEETGRDALTEMRRLLGVLRRDGDGPALAPQPGLSRLEALVGRHREGGLEVALRIEGRERALTPGIDLTAYRVVEDALDAAAEQGAAGAEVLLRYRDEDLQLQVTDDREGDASARLPGLRERVGLYGGNLRAERVDSGFRLRARLPLEGVG